MTVYHQQRPPPHYPGLADALDENSNLLKLGVVRVRLDPPLDTTTGFNQTLVLSTATVTVCIFDVHPAFATLLHCFGSFLADFSALCHPPARWDILYLAPNGACWMLIGVPIVRS